MRSPGHGVSVVVVGVVATTVVVLAAGAAGATGGAGRTGVVAKAVSAELVRLVVPPKTVTAKLSGLGDQEPELATLSVATGRVVRRLSRLPGVSHDQITGPFASGNGSLWYTASSGPLLRSDVLGGDPAPDSCASRVVRFDPKTSVATTVFRSPSSALIGAAVPNPAGTEVAYLTEGCQDYGGWYLVVRNVKTGSEHSIGKTDAPCDELSTPSWSADGRSLMFSWTPAMPPITSAAPQSACRGRLTPDGNIVVVGAGYRGPIPVAQGLADPGCGYVAASFDRWGVAAVEVCGVTLGGSTRFVQLSRKLRPEQRLSLPGSADGVSVSAAPGGSAVAVDEYQSPGLSSNTPTQWLEIYDGKGLRTIDQVTTGDQWPTWATW